MNPSPLPTGDYVLTNFRYLSVYNELVARIGQRQQTLTLFVAIFTGLVTAIVATREIFKTNPATIVWLMVGFPFASIALTLLNFKYETLISLLREYLAEQESIKDANLHYPSYNCSPAYMKRANRARYFHDLTCALLILAYNIAAIGIYSSITPETNPSFLVVTLGVGLTAVGCFAAHLCLRYVHYRPSDGVKSPENATG
jgi:hypothetical protein